MRTRPTRDRVHIGTRFLTTQYLFVFEKRQSGIAYRRINLYFPSHSYKMPDVSHLYKLRSSPFFFVILGILGVLILVLSHFIEIRIILESPAYGDITGVVGTIWSLLLGVATLGSFALGAHNFRSTDNSGGPATEFSIEGETQDIDVHLHVNGRQENEEGAQQTATETTENQESDRD